MKRFLIKFCILFAIIDGFLLWYALAIHPNISGDMGALYKYPFGKAYNDSIKQAHKLDGRYVYNIQNLDSVPKGSIVTIGDSFSQQDSLGYQQYLGHSLNQEICNISCKDNRNPEQNFIRLVNNGVLDSTQVAIVESVERSFIGHLNNLNFNDILDIVLSEKTAQKKSHVDYAEEAMQKLRLMLGYKRPILKYDLIKPLFSHSKYQGNIFIYHSPSIGDSDLLFTNDSNEIINAYVNLEKLHLFAIEHNIKMIYLVVPDKYDVYYPYIVSAPKYNITLDFCPRKEYIINPRKELRKALDEGEMDVWYLNDTHWSPVGAMIVAKLTEEKLTDLSTKQ